MQLVLISLLKKLGIYYFDILGVPSITKDHDIEAVYIGAVGARFERPNLMEWQEIIIDSKSKDSPISSLFKKFYKERLNIEDTEMVKDSVDSKKVMNAPIYMERISISAETYLLEANQRGKFKNLKVHAVVVGLGLGVWQINDLQVSHIYITISIFMSVRHCAFIAMSHFRFLQLYRKLSQIKVAWYVLKVKNIHFRSPSDPWGP